MMVTLREIRSEKETDSVDSIISKVFFLFPTTFPVVFLFSGGNSSRNIMNTMKKKQNNGAKNGYEGRDESTNFDVLLASNYMLGFNPLKY